MKVQHTFELTFDAIPFATPEEIKHLTENHTWERGDVRVFNGIKYCVYGHLTERMRQAIQAVTLAGIGKVAKSKQISAHIMKNEESCMQIHVNHCIENRTMRILLIPFDRVPVENRPKMRNLRTW